MIDIETLLSPYGPTAKSLGEVHGAVTSDIHDEDVPADLDTITFEPAEIPRPAAGKHRAEVPTDSIAPSPKVVPIQLGRLSA